MESEKDIYYKRDIDKVLLDWKNDPHHKALKIIGARQIGKTTSILHFAEANYENIIYLNLENINGKALMNLLKETIHLKNGAVQEKDFLLDFFAQNGFTYTDDKNTIFIIDEIQKSDLVWGLIRPINNSMNCDLIVTGSNLAITSRYFQPLGNIDSVKMHTMSFSEFLWCMKFDEPENHDGMENLRELYESDKMGDLTKEQYKLFLNTYEIYCKVGGYPAIVKSYFTDGNFMENRRKVFQSVFETVQDELTNVIEQENKKNNESEKNKEGEENKNDKKNKENSTSASKVKTKYRVRLLCDALVLSVINEKKGDKNLLEHLTTHVKDTRPDIGVNKNQIYNLLEWLAEADVISYCSNYDLVKNTKGKSMRIYFNDVGLLYYLLETVSIDEGARLGILAEHFVYKSIFNYKPDSASVHFGIYNNYEYDFILKCNTTGDLKVIEVKNSNGRCKSMEALMKIYPDYKYDFYMGNTTQRNNGEIRFLPIYLSDREVLSNLKLKSDKENIMSPSELLALLNQKKN